MRAVRQIGNGWWRRSVPALALALSLTGCDAVGTLTICSDVGGRLTRGEQPAAGVVLTRNWRWALTDESGSDQATTDADGRFRFARVERRKPLRASFPHEPVIRMEFTVRNGADRVVVATANKHDYGNGAGDEYRPKPASGYTAVFDR